MGDYIDISYIEDSLGTSFTDDTTPNITQVDNFISLAEEEFERNVGVFKLIDNTEILNGTLLGLKVSNLPINSITSIEHNDGTRFDIDWSTIDSDEYVIDEGSIGTILLACPIVGDKNYRVVYSSGYDFDDVPLIFKNLVFLYAMRHVFNNTLFATNGDVSGSSEIIDVDVYRQVTNGGNPYNGIVSLNNVINSSQQKVFRSLRTFVL